MSYQEIVLEITNYVNATSKEIPLTGEYSEGIEGWQWDRRISSFAGTPSTKFLTYLGGHEDGLLDGTKLQHWQSGVIDGIEFESIAHMRLGNDLTWTPRYTVGSFSSYWDSRVLFSDYSFSENAVGTIDGRSVLNLRADAVYNSVVANLFKRMDSYQIGTAKQIKLVNAFTGIIADEARLELAEGLPDDWSKVETRKQEMIIEDGVLYFNQDMSLQVGVSYIDVTEVEASWENKGKGLRAGRPLFCQYFPLAPGSVELISVDVAGTITTWAERPSLNFSGPDDLHFSVNYDLGTIVTGGYAAPALVLAAAVDAYDEEIQTIVSDSFSSYPQQGIIVIGNEQIYYVGKTSNSFLGCLRGYNGTVAEDHDKGVSVQDRQHGRHTTDTWWLKYKAVPRVDYEVSDYNLRSANYSTWLDVRSLRNVKTNNIVQIVSQDINLAEIILSTDSPLIGGNLYGPVYYGTDVSKLTAKGLDSAGNPVEDIELTIYIKDGVGQLNGSTSSYSADSNSLGEISCFYNAPYDNDNALIEVMQVEHVGANTHMTVNLTNKIVPSEVWVFQILKHDPVLGSVGDSARAVAAGAAVEPNGSGYVDVYMLHTEDYNGGSMLLEDSSSIRRSLPIRWAEKRYDLNNEPFVRFFVESVVDPSWISGSAPIWLFQEEAVEWDPVRRRGARVILYEWSVNAVHPITKVEGAFMPVRPDAVQGNVLIFNNRLLPIPAPSDANDNLGAYVVIAPSETRCSAYGRDPYTGQLIVSNDIRLRLRLPNTLTGVDEVGGLPIPYGWTLVTEEFNIGAGLDGANFITINPAASGINQFSIRGTI